jgi:hypothetical protein
MGTSSKIRLSGSFLFLILICLFGCYEPIEDCLKLTASNYSLFADDACDDCCQFPNVNVQFSPVWENVALVTDSIYSNDIGETFSVNEASFFVSNILLANDSLKLVTQDSILLSCDNTSDLVVYNSMAAVSLTSQIAASREIPITLGFNQLEFEIGVNECLAQADTLLFDDDDFVSGSTFLDQKIADQEYISASFQLLKNIGEPSITSITETIDTIIVIDTMFVESIDTIIDTDTMFTVAIDTLIAMDTTSISSLDTIITQLQDTLDISFNNEEFNELFQLESLIGDFDITPGSNLSIEVFVDYSVLFSTVSFDDTEESIKNDINNNLMTAFSLMQ